MLIALAMMSCSKEDPRSQVCTFVDNPEAGEGAISHREANLIADCDDNPITDIEELTKVFDGTAWTLDGFGHGWFFEVNKPCITIDFSGAEVSVKYIDSQRDTVTSHTWEIEQNNGSLGLRLEPPMYEVHMTNFSSDIMYHNGTPYDGNLYIYTKLD